MNKYFILSGMIAVCFYTIHIILGGLLWKGYNHIMQPISDLTASGAPNREILNKILNFYAIFSLTFAIILIKDFNISKNFRIGAYLFLGMHLVSLAYSWFPQDLPNTAMTFKGFMHLIITALIIPFTILAPIFIGLGLKANEQFRNLGNFSVLCGVLILIFGAITAVFFAKKLPNFGIVERLNIGTLQFWTLILSYKLFISVK